jgi:S1-C subfamily serine protease
MQIIIDIITAGLMGYLAFTNFLAGYVTSALEFVTPSTYEVNEADTAVIEVPTPATETPLETSLTPLSSIFAKIPNILRESAQYQAATVIESTSPSNEIPGRTPPTEGIVNIYCTFTNDRTIRTTTGTGFLINDSGIILTNAHVAQFLLLEKTDVLGESDCAVRMGSPATPQYMAELLYIPPAWVAEHAALIDAKAPSGTGERDYALLHITKRLDGSPLPPRFPTLTLDTNTPTRKTVAGVMTAAGYPAETVVGDTTSNLLARSATTTISELFTFGDQAVDVLALRGSKIGEQGASGGPVVNEAGYVIGMITTRGNDNQDGAGSLRAITIDHINRTITEETGAPLSTHLQGNVTARANIFADTITPFLTELLTKEIGGETI